MVESLRDPDAVLGHAGAVERVASRHGPYLLVPTV